MNAAPAPCGDLTASESHTSDETVARNDRLSGEKYQFASTKSHKKEIGTNRTTSKGPIVYNVKIDIR